jgi:SAM-dependent methyltransferase
VPEPTACAWCHAPLAETGVPLRGRVLCSRCGVATTSPWPSDAELDAAYGDWYRPEAGRFSGIGDAILRRSRGALARRIDAIAPAGRVLDVGAGDGALLDAIAATGRERLGLERRIQRSDVRDAAVEELDPPWSAVVLWHSLEHLRDPAGALRAASDLLGERGVIVVAVPNSDSLQAKAFGDRWLALDLPRHLVHIPARALLDRLRECGLRVTRVSYVRGGQVVFGWLHGLVAGASGLDLYDAIRRPEARSRPMSGGRRAAALALGALLSPVAVAAAAVEVALRRGGSVYVEAVRG